MTLRSLVGAVLAAAFLHLALAAPLTAQVQMVVPEGEAQQYWSRWRGPSGQGLVNGSGYPDTWSDTENVLWKADIPGEGASSPIVWADRIFITTAEGGNSASILSYRRSDGERLWQTEIPDTTRERLHPKNTNASATVSTDGQLVYASFGSKGLVAVDFDGNVAWHRSLGTINNYHGTAGSPLLYKDTIIIYQDHDGGSQGGAFVAAFDKTTGEPVWRTSRRASVGWGSPIALNTGERDELIVSSQRRVQAYDPATGIELWTCDGNLFEVIPTPVVGHGMVFCSSGRAGPTLAIRPGGSGNVTDTHVVWSSPKGSPFVPSPLLSGDRLYLVNDMASIVTCYNARTGEVLWQGRLGRAVREGMSASPVVVDGKVFFMNDSGQTFVVRDGPEFELLHVNELNATTLASPALVDGMWYFRTNRELIAIGN
ncbi:MAG: PQQ-binding-like beta-propeller repeat protein [Vicinamibacterales bacterium]|nr:hypothetical protein [Acidobacteriota bacterium]MDP7295259.1 PQQ-binding-like beta-propeller repeat protein [Vicinamibacterales bacterium]MDP7480062.1 PQQ-binding-like beta-propeller repeat protein [Vicinamibacterales bacterium]MDP7672741.1 PQQ-binding-like beta-propeller repeat protein [Vicinamibacterales bacterium]HJO37536.1 PQQ-binding-like beta-propeller repeat protein [Vicinamibacterales bacterium]